MLKKYDAADAAYPKSGRNWNAYPDPNAANTNANTALNMSALSMKGTSLKKTAPQ